MDDRTDAFFTLLVLYLFFGGVTGFLMSEVAGITESGMEIAVTVVFWPVFAIKYAGIFLYDFFSTFFSVIGA